MEEAMATAFYTSGPSPSSSGRNPSRKQRWTLDEVQALVDGVEKHGLSAWRTIVQVRVVPVT